MTTNTKTRATKNVNGKTATGKAGKIAGMRSETVASVLAGKPDGATAREIAGATKLAQSTVTTALKTLARRGNVVCIPGRSKDNPRTADVWRSTPTGGPDGPGDESADTATDTEAPDTVGTPASDSGQDGDSGQDSAEATTTQTDTPARTDTAAENSDGDTTSDTATEAAAPSGAAAEEPDPGGTPVEAPVSVPPVMSEADRFRVLVVVGCLGDNPDGISAADLVDKSMLNPRYLARMLAAMEVTGAARRLPPDETGTELWVRGDADPTTVDLANAPTHTTCPTCGHRRRIAVTVGRTGRDSGEAAVNGDGAPKLVKGELRGLVRQYIAARPEEIHTAGSIARGIQEESGRVISSGAVRNNLDYLIGQGEITATDEDGKEVTAVLTADQA